MRACLRIAFLSFAAIRAIECWAIETPAPPTPAAAFAQRAVGLSSLNSQDPASGAQFQFEICLFPSAGLPLPAEQEAVRVICESRDGHAAALIGSSSGLPYAFMDDSGVYVAAAGDGPTLWHFPGFKFKLACTQPDRFLKVDLDKRFDRSSCELDLFRWCHALLALPFNVTEDRLNQSFEFRRVSNIKIRFRRDKWPGSFPIASIDALDMQGSGYSITNICRQDFAAPVFDIGAALRDHFGGVIQTRADADAGELRDLLLLNEPSYILTRLKDPQIALSAKECQSAIARAGANADDKTRALTASVLDLIEVKRRGESDDRPPDDGLVAALRKTDSLVFDAVVMPTFWPRNVDDFYLVGGYDRTSSLARLAAALDRTTLESFLELLADLASDADAHEDARFLAMDLLGATGAPRIGQTLDRARESLQDSSNEELAIVLASASVRNYVARQEDIALLQQSLREAKDRQTALICIEALCLADASAGFQKELEQWILADPQEHDLFMRCLMAAPCSAEGRQLLIRAMSGIPPKLPPDFAIPLLRYHADPSSAEWIRYSEIVEEVALNPKASPHIRYFSALIASARPGDARFRDSFVRSALQSEDLQLLVVACTEFLIKDKNGALYLPLLATAFQSGDVDTRRLIITTLPKSCPRRIDSKHMPLLQQLIDQGLMDADENVRGDARRAAAYFAQADDGPAVPGIVE